jgi:hypothetical protein
VAGANYVFMRKDNDLRLQMGVGEDMVAELFGERFQWVCGLWMTGVESDS